MVRLHLWPHRSLPRRGFVAFMGVTFALVFLPLGMVLGTQLLWGMLPFVLGVPALMWWFLEKSYRDGEILEDLALWSDHACLTRSRRGAALRRWDANPYWITLTLHRKGGPVPAYLTMKGAGREVELGAFLSEEEREALYHTLNDVLQRIVASAGPGRA